MSFMLRVWALRVVSFVVTFIVRGLAGLFWGLVVAGRYESYIVLAIIGTFSKSLTLLILGGLSVSMKLVALFICEDFKINIIAIPKKWGAGNTGDSE